MQPIKTFFIVGMLGMCLVLSPRAEGKNPGSGPGLQAGFLTYLEQVYTNCDLKNKLDREVFEYAMIGYFNLRQQDFLKKPDILSIADYSQPSRAKRFFVLDLQKEELLFHSRVAHGKNTGEQYAKSFSNRPNSKQTSLGFIVTEDTYFGKHGLSLRLKGTEERYNSNCFQRYIVVHGADYASENFVQQYGRLGRSWGCPALPGDVSSRVIDHIRDGTCFFSYSDDEEYLGSSEFLDFEAALDAFIKLRPQILNRETVF